MLKQLMKLIIIIHCNLLQFGLFIYGQPTNWQNVTSTPDPSNSSGSNNNGKFIQII